MASSPDQGHRKVQTPGSALGCGHERGLAFSCLNPEGKIYFVGQLIFLAGLPGRPAFKYAR